MKGLLIYDSQADRLAIAPEVSYLKHDYDNLHHLHCGHTIEVLRNVVTETTKPIWIPTRVEKGHSKDPDMIEWYLADLYKIGEIPNDLTVRIGA